jgi:prepilin peptidase CpaA
VERYLLICALGIATMGAVTDVRDRRIPNWLTYGGLVAALRVRCALLSWLGLRGGLLGLLLGGGIFFLLFVLGGMGGGDVKLMAAVGAWAGTAQAPHRIRHCRRNSRGLLYCLSQAPAPDASIR